MDERPIPTAVDKRPALSVLVIGPYDQLGDIITRDITNAGDRPAEAGARACDCGGLSVSKYAPSTPLKT